MGASQSGLATPAAKESLYDLIGAERSASEDELKRAYKKMALKLHPDRNYANPEEATTRFAKVQAAFDLLSDPQERAWYDNHGESNEYNEYSSFVTKTDEVKRYADPAYGRTLDPAKDEFYRLVGELFDRLRNEEIEAAFDQGIDPQDVAVNGSEFGNLGSSWPQVRQFYDAWDNFSSYKSFSWEDLYPTHHAPDRRTKRAMEGRNKRIRDAARREYNHAVRSLVTAVRNADLRVKKQKKTQEKESQKIEKEKQERERVFKEGQKVKKEYNEQDWAKVDYANADGKGQALAPTGQTLAPTGQAIQAAGDDLDDLLECLVCDIDFDTKEEMIEHELSPKHTKALKQFQREMRAESVALGLDSQYSDRSELSLNASENSKKTSEKTSESASRQTSESPATETDAGAAADDLSSKLQSLSVEDIMAQLDSHKGSRKSDPKEPAAKKGKAKQRRQKKNAPNEFALKCATCQTAFPSRDQLQSHVAASKHTAFGF